MDGAMHVQYKDREVFDREDRIIPRNVFAVSIDTGGFRLGDGSKTWRELAVYGDEFGEPAETPVSGYSGPLHVRFLDDDEFNEFDMTTPPWDLIPSLGEVVVMGQLGLYFGNGVDSLGSGNLPRLSDNG